jgi:hypothetical protein
MLCSGVWGGQERRSTRKKMVSRSFLCKGRKEKTGGDSGGEATLLFNGDPTVDVVNRMALHLKEAALLSPA